MSSFTEQSQADSASPSREADSLRSSYSGRFPAAPSSNCEESEVDRDFFYSSQATDDAGLLSALKLDSHETDAERKSLPVEEGVHERILCEARSSNGSKHKDFSDSASVSSRTGECHGSHTEEKEACHVTSALSGHTTALTHSPPTERSSPTGAEALHSKKITCAGGTPHGGSGTVLPSAHTCGARTPDVGHHRRRMHRTQDCGEAGQNEAPLTTDSRGLRRLPAESNTSRGHHEMTQRMRGEHPRQMTNRAGKTGNLIEPEVEVAIAAGSAFKKEGTGPERPSQRRTTTSSIRRQLVHKSGKKLPTHHSASSRSLPVSRRSSFVHCADTENKKVYSRGSTMDTEVASTRSEDTHGDETQGRQTIRKRDFIRENAQNACVQQHQRQPKQIKSHLKEEAKKALDKEAADKLPAGMRVMGNEERLETVQRLKKEQTEAEQELSRMPIAIKTDSQRRRIEFLERRLGELDREQQKYSKPNILVGV